MDLYASIARRKSCRKYDMQPLDAQLLGEIETAIQGFEPLFADVPLEHRVTDKVKGRFHVEAPHYLIVSGRGKPSEMESAGYLFEQLVLWLDARELGSVWLGASKDAQAKNVDADIIVIAFGKTEEPVHRTREEFKRKPIAEITNAPQDVCMQAVHLAPSGMNTQPWFFEKQQNAVLVYQQKLKPSVSLLYKLSDLDMGIALSHYALACKKNGEAFHFRREAALPDKAGYLPFGIME